MAGTPTRRVALETARGFHGLAPAASLETDLAQRAFQTPADAVECAQRGEDRGLMQLPDFAARRGRVGGVEQTVYRAPGRLVRTFHGCQVGICPYEIGCKEE